MFDQLINQLAATSWVEWLGMVTGIAGVWLSVRQKIAAWPFFIICYSSYVLIGYRVGLLSFVGMNAVFIGISAYGWLKWAGSIGKDQAELPVSHTSRTHWPFLLVFLLIGTAGIGWLLAGGGEARLPYLDAFATSCGFVAQWMLGRKQIETWIFWIILDGIYFFIFASQEAWPSVILFSTFIVLAIHGWGTWQREIATTPAGKGGLEG